MNVLKEITTNTDTLYLTVIKKKIHFYSNELECVSQFSKQGVHSILNL